MGGPARSDLCPVFPVLAPHSQESRHAAHQENQQPSLWRRHPSRCWCCRSLDTDAWSLDDHWPELLAALADQFTESVSSLQNQADQLLAKGRINKLEHRALSIPAERIKLAGVSAQQIHRFYAGRIRQSHEKVDMAQLAEGVLQERKQELGILGIALRRKFKPVEVLIDPTVAHTFINAVLDWGLPFGNRVDLRLDLNAWPQHARLADARRQRWRAAFQRRNAPTASAGC